MAERFRLELPVAGVENEVFAYHCPACGSKNLRDMDVGWYAHSLDTYDVHNSAVLNEWQCVDCAISFWV